jgi:hypothetical protein
LSYHAWKNPCVKKTTHLSNTCAELLLDSTEILELVELLASQFLGSAAAQMECFPPCDALALLDLFSNIEKTTENGAKAYGIQVCDLCGCDLSGGGFFVDGCLRVGTLWANMCLPCFKAHGQGIGWGNGQLYARQRSGSWLLIAGACPNAPC